jgi:hypothetical protein
VCNGKIYATNSSNEIWSSSPNNISWTKVGSAVNVVSLTACNGKIYGANSSNEIWVTDCEKIDWIKLGSASNVKGLAIPE